MVSPTKYSGLQARDLERFCLFLAGVNALLPWFVVAFMANTLKMGEYSPAQKADRAYY
jgi:hypothetical protein